MEVEVFQSVSVWKTNVKLLINTVAHYTCVTKLGHLKKFFFAFLFEVPFWISLVVLGMAHFFSKPPQIISLHYCTNNITFP